MIAAVVFDLPDLFIGRMYSTVRAVLPDMRQNIRTMAQTHAGGQHADVGRPAQRGAPPGGPADPHPQRMGLLRPHHAGHTALEFATIARVARCCGCPAATAGCWPGPRARRTSSPTSSRAASSSRGWRAAGASSRHASTRCAPSTDDRRAGGLRPRPHAPGEGRHRDQPAAAAAALAARMGGLRRSIGVLVFAEDAVMLGFVFPGETAAILGGVLASKGGVSLGGILAVVIVCAIVGDSVGYAVGERWGRQLLQLGPLRKRQKGIDTALDQLSRRGAIAVFVGRFSAFLRAVIPGLAGMSKLRYRVFLPANAVGGICWGFLYILLGYFVGERVEKATGIASDVLLGAHRRDRRRARGAPPPQGRSASSRAPPSPPRPERPRRLTGASARRTRGQSGHRRAGRRAPGRTPRRRRPPQRRCPSSAPRRDRCGPGRRGRSAARRCPTRSCRPTTSGGRPCTGSPPRPRRPPHPGAPARTGPVHAVLPRPRPARRAPGSPCRSPPPRAGGRDGGRPRWRTRTAGRPGAIGCPTGPARRTSRRPVGAGDAPGRARAWLATGSYQSKPTASRVRVPDDACAAADDVPRPSPGA